MKKKINFASLPQAVNWVTVLEAFPLSFIKCEGKFRDDHFTKIGDMHNLKLNAMPLIHHKKLLSR